MNDSRIEETVFFTRMSSVPVKIIFLTSTKIKVTILQKQLLLQRLKEKCPRFLRMRIVYSSYKRNGSYFCKEMSMKIHTNVMMLILIPFLLIGCSGKCVADALKNRQKQNYRSRL